jgi:hypothetical protein
MCNAHNHPPNCNCGWGGIWYGSSNADSYAGIPRRGPKPRVLGLQKATNGPLSGAYTNPNATCPVCGAACYFYQSPYGGRVFFDELGPPWPKHPCTTNEPARLVSMPRKGNHIPWNADCWRTLRHVSILEDRYPDVYVIGGYESFAKRLQFRFHAPEIIRCEIVRFKQRASGEFYLSILDYDDTNESWQLWSGIAYVSEDAAKSGTGALAKTYLPLDRLGLEPVPTSSVRSPASNIQSVSAAATLAHSSSVPSATQGASFASREAFAQCPACQCKVKRKNLVKHLRRFHGLGEKLEPLLPRISAVTSE